MDNTFSQTDKSFSKSDNNIIYIIAEFPYYISDPS